MFDRVVQYGTSVQRVGAANMQGLTLVSGQGSPMDHQSPQSEELAATGEGAASEGSPHFFLVGFIVLLAILWMVRNQSEALQREVLGVNIFNLMTIGLTAVLFIALGKIVTSRFVIPGLTPLFAAL